MKVIIVMPAYRAERTLARTIAAIPPDTADEIILVDDASPDDTIALARSLGLTVIVHDRNRGYGGNQKTCYRAALATGADIVVMVHPDFQYDPSFIPQLIAPIAAGTADAVFGSRMRTPGGARAGGMPWWKYVANIGLTRIGNAVLRTAFSEFHSGFRAYSRRFLETAPFERNADGFVFDTEIIVQGKTFEFRMDEIPITTRYFPEASMIGFGRSVQYGIAFCATLIRYLLHRTGIRRDRCFIPIEISARCVGCGEHRCQIVAPNTTTARGDSAAARPYAITEHGGGHGTIVQCGACNLQFVPAHEVSAEDAFHLYRTQPVDREYLREEHARRTTARRVLRMLRTLTDAGGGERDGEAPRHRRRRWIVR